MPGINLRYDPDDLVSFMIMDTGVYQADGTQHSQRWQNPWGKVKIVGTQLSIWADYGMRADMTCSIWREADNVPIHLFGWDHYAECTVPRQESMRWYHPYGWYLYPGDWLVLKWSANAFDGSLRGAGNNGIIYLPAGPLEQLKT